MAKKTPRQDVVIGIDPGLSTGAAVVLSCADGAILAARSYAPATSVRGAAKKAFADRIGDRAFAAADYIAKRQSESMLHDVQTWADEFAVQKIGVESFVDLPSKALAEKSILLKDRWKTPLLLGYLNHGLRALGFIPEQGMLVYQNPGVVLRHFAQEVALLGEPLEGRGVIVAGEEHLTSSHHRTAWAHAAWLLLRLNEDSPNTCCEGESAPA